MIDTAQFNYYRNVQLWPLANEFNYEEWLNNFDEGGEREIAIKILDFFMFFPDSLINQMFATVIGKCGYYFQRVRGSWSEEQFKTDCWYSFVPGEEVKTTDSGYIFQRKLRDNLYIPESQLLSYEQLQEKLSSDKNLNVILVDDFVGSGHQTYVAWSCEGRKYKDKTLSEWAEANGHCVTYAPLIVNYIGKEFIRTCCRNLELTYIHELTPEFNLFSKDCPCWEGDEVLFQSAMELIARKSRDLKIPFTDGKTVIDVQGYHKQGLAIAFSHGIPDACPPIFYWETKDWKPLMNRVYSRP